MFNGLGFVLQNCKQTIWFCYVSVSTHERALACMHMLVKLMHFYTTRQIPLFIKHLTQHFWHAAM